MRPERNLDAVAELLADEKVRQDVIQFLARDFAKDFLVPVRIDFDAMAGGVASCKEWQE